MDSVTGHTEVTVNWLSVVYKKKKGDSGIVPVLNLL